MNEKNLINKLINDGWITFNPFTMSVHSPRYVVILDDTEQHEIQNTDITELVTDLIIRSEHDCPFVAFKMFKENAFIDVYAFDTFAEVTWQIAFNTLKELRHYKKVAELKTLYYYDQETEQTKEL